MPAVSFVGFHDGHKAEGNSMKACFFHSVSTRGFSKALVACFCWQRIWTLFDRAVERRGQPQQGYKLWRGVCCTVLMITPRLSLFMSSERVNLSCFLKKWYDASDVMQQMFINCLRPYCSQNLRLHVCFVGLSKFAAQKLQETLHCIVLLLLDGWNVFKSASEVLRWMSSAGGRQGLFQGPKITAIVPLGRSRWEPLSTVQETCSRGAALTLLLKDEKTYKIKIYKDVKYVTFWNMFEWFNMFGSSCEQVKSEAHRYVFSILF